MKSHPDRKPMPSRKAASFASPVRQRWGGCARVCSPFQGATPEPGLLSTVVTAVTGRGAQQTGEQNAVLR